MISISKHKNITWIDLESPEADEVKNLMRDYNIPPLVADELLRPTVRPKADPYTNLIYLILHFPVFDISKKASTPCEIDFIIGKKFLVTAHYQSIIPLHEMIKTFEVGMLLGDNRMANSTGMLMFFIVRNLYDFALRQLDHIQTKISDIEDQIFNGREKEMVKEISFVQRDILEFQRSVHAHESVLKSLGLSGEKFLGKDFIYYLKSMSGELAKVENLLENSKNTIGLLRETNDSLLSNKTNEIMKTLTVLAFITFPVMFLSSLFSMNTEALPIIGIPGDFWIVITIMAISATAVFMLFKRKKWL